MANTHTHNDEHKPSSNVRTARLDLRVSPDDKALIQQAAEAEGLSQTDFILSCVKAEARRIVHDYEVMRLSEQDREIFIEAFLNPPEPNARLRQAADNYRKRLTP